MIFTYPGLIFNYLCPSRPTLILHIYYALISIWDRSFLTFQVLRIQRYIWPNPSPSCLKVAPVKFPLSSSLSHPRYNSTSTNMSNRLVLVSAEQKATWNDQVNSSSMIFFAHPGSVQYLALWFYDYTFFYKIQYVLRKVQLSSIFNSFDSYFVIQDYIMPRTER